MMQNPSSSSSSSSPPMFHGNPNTAILAKSVIDDAWNDVVPRKQMMRNPLPSAEIRLEEYLRNQQDHFVQNNSSSVPLMANIDQAFRDWQQQEMDVVPMHEVQALVGSNFQVSENSNTMMNLGYLGKQLKMSEPTEQLVAERSADHSKGNQTQKKRDFADDRTETGVERRQRRMIKNRESAARSRARKQAYIDELQHKVWQLQATNNWLRKRKEVIILLNSDSISRSRYQLRRTNTIN